MASSVSEGNVFVVRESSGTYALNGPSPNDSTFKSWDTFKKDNEESRFTTLSPNGTLLAIGNNKEVNVFATGDGQLKCRLMHRLLSAKFSPNDGYLIGWDNPSKDNDNFNIWSINGGSKNPTKVHSLKLSKQNHVEFSSDEKYYARLSNNSIIFSSTTNFHETLFKTPETLKVGNFAISPYVANDGNGQIYVSVFLPDKTGAPSFARIFRYPNFDNPITSRSFFQSDRTEMKWNKKGTAVLVVATSDIDKTGESYYGKTMLYYLDIKGESVIVQEADSNTTNVIHACEWSPSSTEFAIITGKMPQTRAVLMNLKCEKILDMGVAARNTIHFNPQGNIVLLCAFGNLQGNIEVWEIKHHKKQLNSLKVPDTTQLTWLNDGVHFVTATTAPRMQIGNGFKVWSISGKTVWEWKANKHLFGIIPFISHPSLPFNPDAEKLVEELSKKSSHSEKSGGSSNVAKNTNVYIPVHKRKGLVGAAVPVKPGSGSSGGDSAFTEKEKKIRTLKKKIKDIEKLKEMISQGKEVEKNQLEKLTKEDELLKELKKLELS